MPQFFSFRLFLIRRFPLSAAQGGGDGPIKEIRTQNGTADE
ncbi:hypothetical protein [Roseateles aquatilis]|nr:hypothetical protein [Roseateles aquatilis]